MTPPAGWAQSVLDFWFGELTRADWFRKDEAIDAAIRARFFELYELLARDAVDDALAHPDASLAAILVLDQFSRNMFRGTPRAFATDAKAREIADRAVRQGFDAALPIERRVFIYLPFEHSETPEDQNRAVALLTALGDAEYGRYAQAHADVIRRFGRFPHRNAILGRASTPDEAAYLAEPGSGF
ncbi:MAG: DUF924 family protein [Hyphomicrobium sp.]